MNPGKATKAALLFSVGLVTVLILAACVYWSGLSGPFMLDDGPNIGLAYIANPDWDAIVYTITHNGSGALSRAVSMVSFVLTGLEFGLEPWGYKYHNLLLHLLNGVLLFRFLQMLLPLLDPQLRERSILLVAGFVAAFWLLHPLMVSTVLYAVQRMAQLAALFSLLALLAYLKARSDTGNRRNFYLFGWCLFPAMLLLAVLSKETGILVVLYLLIIELLAFRTGAAALRSSPRLAVFVATFILLPLLAGAVVLTVKFDAIADYSTRTFTLQERLLTQLHVIPFYIRLILLPRIRAMSLFHDDFPVTSGFDALTLLLLALFAGALVLAWRLRRSWPVVSFGICWFIASHALESTVFPLELVFEHRNYLAAAGLLLVPVYCVVRSQRLQPLVFLFPVFGALLAFMTATRAAEWGDRDLFHRMAVDEHPTSTRALNSYVNYLTGNGDYEQSIEYLKKLVELSPAELGAHLHMQVAQCPAGIRDDDSLARAVELAGKYPVSVYAQNALQRLTVLIADRKCPGVTFEDLERVVTAAIAYVGEETPSEPLSDMLRLRGIISFSRGRYAPGYSDFRTAHEITGNIQTLQELMRYQLSGGWIQDAEETLALMEQQDAQRLGIERYQVNVARRMLERGRREHAARLARGDDTPRENLPADVEGTQ